MPRAVIRSWSPGAERLKQYKAEEVIGHHVAMFRTEEDVRQGQSDRELASAARLGRFEAEGWRLRKDGSRFWASTIVSPINDESGELIGFVSVGRDLSEKRAQEQLVQRQQEEILELSTPVIQVWDKVLVLPIIGTLDSARAAAHRGAARTHRRRAAEVAILDVSGVPAVDTEVPSTCSRPSRRPG
jgi:PAS domain S-box-containing protein